MRVPRTTAALLALLASGAAYGDTIAVPKDQPTISDAVAAANDGDTVIVSKGRYAESVTVSGFDGLTIRAKGRVVLAPPGGAGVLVVDSSDVTLQGLRVESAEDGFVIDSCSDVTLTRFSVQGADRHGVFALGSSNVEVSKGRISDCGLDGVSFADEVPGSPVLGGTVSQVRVQDCDEDGFDVLGSDVLVVKCVALRCGDDCFESDDQGAGPVRFERCKAVGSGDECFELGANATTCIRCKASGSGDDGYDVEADDCVVERCTAKGSVEACVSVDDYERARVTRCKAVRCGAYGFATFGALAAIFDGCKAVRTERDGFYVDEDTQGCEFRGCKATKSGDFDLNDLSDGSNTFPGSRFRTTND